MTTRTILLVEDNPDDQALARRALAKHGRATTLIVADDGAQALDYLFGTGQFKGRDTRDQPAVVLLDLKLPKIDGLTALERIRADECTRLIPVLVLTSSLQESDIMRSYQLGANSYVRKPIDFTEFVGAIRLLGDYWLALNRLPHSAGSGL